MNTNNAAKRILCYGDSNTWGWIPSRMGKERYPIDERWPGVLQQLLGTRYEVIEEGLGGRTTMFDDPRPEFPERNGLKALPAILESHLPLDLVIIMLGTTDTKEMMRKESKDSAEGIAQMIALIKEFRNVNTAPAPQILIIVPPIIDETTLFASKLFSGGTAKAKELRDTYKNVCQEHGAAYLDPTAEIIVDKTEGIHIDSSMHRKLAELVYAKIKEMQ